MSWQDEGVSFVDKYLFFCFFFSCIRPFSYLMAWGLSTECPWGLDYISSFVKLCFFCIICTFLGGNVYIKVLCCMLKERFTVI